jgi:adenosine deaminase
MSGVTLTQEYEHARDDLGFTWQELKRIARMGFESSYAPTEVKQKRLDDFDRDVASL